LRFEYENRVTIGRSGAAMMEINEKRPHIAAGELS